MYVDNHCHFDTSIKRGSVRLFALVLVFVAIGYTLFHVGGYHVAFNTINSLGKDFPEALWQALTLSGDAMTLCAFLLLGARRYPQLAWASTLGLLLSLVFVRLAKLALSMPRPPAELAPDSYFHTGPAWVANSFPSGHTLAAALIVSVWMYHSRKLWPLIPSLAFITAVGVSRVVVGVHWPVDTLFGAALGVSCGWLGSIAAQHWTWGLRKPGYTTMIGLLTLASAGLFVVDGGYHQGIGLIRLVAGVAVLAGLRQMLSIQKPFITKRMQPWLNQADAKSARM